MPGIFEHWCLKPVFKARKKGSGFDLSLSGVQAEFDYYTLQPFYFIAVLRSREGFLRACFIFFDWL